MYFSSFSFSSSFPFPRTAASRRPLPPPLLKLQLSEAKRSEEKRSETKRREEKRREEKRREEKFSLCKAGQGRTVKGRTGKGGVPSNQSITFFFLLNCV